MRFDCVHISRCCCSSKLLTPPARPTKVIYPSYIPYIVTVNPSISPATILDDIEYDISRSFNSLLGAHNLNGRALRLVSRHGDPAPSFLPDCVDLGSALADDEAVRLGVREDEISNRLGLLGLCLLYRLLEHRAGFGDALRRSAQNPGDVPFLDVLSAVDYFP